EEPDITLGDVNLDGTVDSKDLTALARHVAGIQILSDDRALANSNVNGDDSVDAKDLTKLARFMAHIIDSL
ncbi:MAG: dockerin type I repeat-containing protein, partial [Firmicutes bacterium]|nr:dockerin type I repeat-containing protein [Bacillota bacterium]